MLSVIGTRCYFSPLLCEAKQNGQEICIHNPEKSEIFSLGLSILQAALLLSVDEIIGLNDKKANGQ